MKLFSILFTIAITFITLFITFLNYFTLLVVLLLFFASWQVEYILLGSWYPSFGASHERLPLCSIHSQYMPSCRFHSWWIFSFGISLSYCVTLVNWTISCFIFTIPNFWCLFIFLFKQYCFSMNLIGILVNGVRKL